LLVQYVGPLGTSPRLSSIQHTLAIDYNLSKMLANEISFLALPELVLTYSMTNKGDLG